MYLCNHITEVLQMYVWLQSFYAINFGDQQYQTISILIVEYSTRNDKISVFIV